MFTKKIMASILIGILPVAIQSTSMAASVNVDVYGKIHFSADYIDNGSSDDITVGSNSSRIGFKGSQPLKHEIKAVWKLESDMDASGERGDLKARNRYLGLKHKAAGTLIVGYHDTPFKTLGGKSGVLHDTIAERRGILGAGNGDNKFNIRGKNSVMYVSPNFSGLEFRAMRSAGDDTDSSTDENPVTSVSAVYKNKMAYVGVAYEEQTVPKVDGSGVRVGGGVKMKDTSINAIYETLSSDNNKKFDRAVYGISAAHVIGDTTLKAQVFTAEDYSGTKDSGGLLWGLGAEYKLDKNFLVYGVVAGVENDDNGEFVLAGSGHGEKYKPASPGDSLIGVSGGMIFKF